jgi:hypothetical protein
MGKAPYPPNHMHSINYDCEKILDNGRKFGLLDIPMKTQPAACKARGIGSASHPNFGSTSSMQGVWDRERSPSTKEHNDFRRCMGDSLIGSTSHPGEDNTKLHARREQ